MKTMELERFNLIELNFEESKNLNGGAWFLAALAIAGAVIYLYNNGPSFVEGFKEGQAAYGT